MAEKQGHIVCVMIDQLVLVKKRKISLQSGEEGPQQHVGYFTQENSKSLFFHPYVIENGVQWHVYKRVVDAFVYNKVYARILPDGPFVKIDGPEHEAFLESLLTKVMPRCGSLLKMLTLYQSVTGSSYESEVKQVILVNLADAHPPEAGHDSLNDLEKEYLRLFLPSIVVRILHELAASEEADQQGQAANTGVSQGGGV